MGPAAGTLRALNSFRPGLVLKHQGQPGQKQDTCLLEALASLAFRLELGVALVESKSRGSKGSDR